MSPIKSILAAVAITFSTASIAAPIASAQATSVAVIDTAKVMRDSSAGKDIRTKIQAIGTTMDNEIAPKRTQYQTANQTFVAKFEGMTEAQINAKVNAEEPLKQEYIGLMQQEQALVQAAQIAGRDLQYTQNVAWRDFNNSLRDVLKEVVAERGADILLDKSSLVFSGPSVDVTALVITKLDAKTPTINVVRQSPPAQAAPAQ